MSRVLRLLLLVSVSSQSLFSLMRLNLVSFSFSSARHFALLVLIRDP